MNLCHAIEELRDCGEVRCGIVEATGMTISRLAEQFDLKPDASIYREISHAQAHKLVEKILYRDLAYGVKIISLGQAQSLTEQFLQGFDIEASQYYTNGDFYLDGTSHGWTSATAWDATFDTGILILSAGKAGCLWVADED
ncbi:hypothetical protein IQ266_10870 [filamentous cyanobacterium LEGE 11480]|uniref:Uncharacterized protein n=1 Tax=Romeriopsis navalis LEGE 11480 TaxID=2777977 RepID=A0A928VPM8_9CYAN|nr:hypothetical protein [Romeriopsis navalis]MBE9030232.1 hypothetical protein [Romeriopsis navalis LEGE 11480]